MCQCSPLGRALGVIFALGSARDALAAERQSVLRRSDKRTLKIAAVRASHEAREASDASEFLTPSELRPLWPLRAVVLTTRELQSTSRTQHIQRQLRSAALPFRMLDGDYAGRYGSLMEQFEELSLTPEKRATWIAGRAQNDLLREDLIGNADAFCDVPACMLQPNCVCVRDAEALPADSLLSILSTHRRAWQAIADDASSDDSRWHLLLEDDAELQPGVGAKYFEDFAVPSEADLVWLYRGEYSHRCWAEKGEENLLMSGPVFNTSDYNGVAYAITKVGARKLLQKLPHDGSPVDIAMSRVVGDCGMKAFCPPSGRYPVTDSSYQKQTTRLAIPKANFEYDDRPPVSSSFLQLTAAAHASRIHPLGSASRPTPEKQLSSPITKPRRRVKCPPESTRPL